MVIFVIHKNLKYYNFRGSAISKIIGKRCQEDDFFEKDVAMYVYEEMIGDRKLTDIINTEHENVKYLPGHKLPANIVSLFYYY